MQAARTAKEACSAQQNRRTWRQKQCWQTPHPVSAVLEERAWEDAVLKHDQLWGSGKPPAVGAGGAGEGLGMNAGWLRAPLGAAREGWKDAVIPGEGVPSLYQQSMASQSRASQAL